VTRPILWTSTFTSGSLAHQAATVSGLDIEVRFISLRSGDHKKPEYLAINPKGEVPALQLPDGTAITETPAILFWLGEAAPDSGLIPSDPLGRAKALEWLAWCHWSMGRHFNPIFGAKRFAGGDEAAAEAVRTAALARARSALEFADAALARNGGTLLGTSAPTAPDLFIIALAGFARMLKIETADLPALGALAGRVLAMPGVAAAMERERAHG
jgi:glutathione S-transferase